MIVCDSNFGSVLHCNCNFHELMFYSAAHCKSVTCPEEGFVGKDCKCWCPTPDEGYPAKHCDGDNIERSIQKIAGLTDIVARKALIKKPNNLWERKCLCILYSSIETFDCFSCYSEINKFMIVFPKKYIPIK